MISRVYEPRRPTLWHTWRAWYPVRVHCGGSGAYVWVWMSKVRRRITQNAYNDVTEYRLIP